jgi:hypothetical protein
MKFGQALSIFEAALPPEVVGPYRATLARLQESAPPLPARTVHRVLAGDMGEEWRASFAEDLGAVDRLPGGSWSFSGNLLRLMHEDSDLEQVENELRSHGFLCEGVSVDPTALQVFLTPLAEPSKVESFRFSRNWLRPETTRVLDMRRRPGQILPSRPGEPNPGSRSCRPGRRVPHSQQNRHGRHGLSGQPDEIR